VKTGACHHWDGRYLFFYLAQIAKNGCGVGMAFLPIYYNNEVL
jgi:hypothetical protein